MTHVTEVSVSTKTITSPDLVYVEHPDFPGIAAAIPRGASPYDSELRHAAEPFGFYEFAWLPRRCRNGKLRWWCAVERHADGTFTLGNRAH